MKVTRAELESLCADLLDRVDIPIKTVLAAAKMKTVSGTQQTYGFRDDFPTRNG